MLSSLQVPYRIFFSSGFRSPIMRIDADPDPKPSEKKFLDPAGQFCHEGNPASIIFNYLALQNLRTGICPAKIPLTYFFETPDTQKSSWSGKITRFRCGSSNKFPRDVLSVRWALDYKWVVWVCEYVWHCFAWLVYSTTAWRDGIDTRMTLNSTALRCSNLVPSWSIRNLVPSWSISNLVPSWSIRNLAVGLLSGR